SSLDLEHADEAVVVNGIGDVTLPQLELERPDTSRLERLGGLESLLAFLGELIALPNEIVQDRTTAYLVPHFHADGMRCRYSIDASGRASDDNFVLTQRHRSAVGVEHENLEGVIARLGQIDFDADAFFQDDASGRPPGIQTVDLKFDSSRNRISKFGDDLCLGVRRTRDVVERQIKRSTGADGSSGTLAPTALRRPIDGFGEDRSEERRVGKECRSRGAR